MSDMEPDANINQQLEDSQPTTPPLRGKDLAYATLDWIKANPQHWNQRYWHCGTSHCFAGTAEMLGAGLDPAQEHPDRQPDENDPDFDDMNPEAYWGMDTSKTALEMLEIPSAEFWYPGEDRFQRDLFHSGNSLLDLEKYVEVLFGARTDNAQPSA